LIRIQRRDGQEFVEKMAESSKSPPSDIHGPNSARLPPLRATPLDSRELLRCLHTGDDAAATEAFDRYVARLIALVRSRLGNRLARRIDAEDVVQSAFGSFYAGAANDEFVHAQAGDLWRLLARIALNKLHKQIEKHSAGRRAVDREVAEGQVVVRELKSLEPTPGEAVALAEQLHLFQANLSPLDQKALSMRLNGAMAEEIATSLGKSVRTVRRALALLQRQLETQLEAASSDPIASRSVSHRRKDPRAPLEYADFVIERLIAAGGMGKVYRARQRSTGRTVALKALHKRRQADRRVVEKFLQEAQILARLDHPHIVRFEGVGQFPGGGYFLTMEFIDGQSLQTILNHGPLPPVEAMRIVGDAATAIAHAHARGIVHGDLKPGNILLDSMQRVVVTDFGLAQFVAVGASSREPLWIVGGTAGYIAPEVHGGRRPTPAADIYGLGALLQALLSGDPRGPLPSNLPDRERLTSVIHTALATAIGVRFPDVAAFSRALLMHARA
jgi:DNA-directed RNA polymerase specialized sigma24 family protein/tRNA A-37 threonylcarbamoyl transferase component Bud32